MFPACHHVAGAHTARIVRSLLHSTFVAMSSAMFVALFVAMQVTPVHAEWPQFRGANSAGKATQAVPVEFGPGKNELWSVPLDAGHSSPCIAGGRIFLTTYQPEASKLFVVCLNQADGETLWSREVPTTEIEKGHPSFNPASSSPTTDGERVVAYFGSFGLICFDMSGRKLWDVQMPITKSYAGNATSPMIAGDRVILYRGNHVDHFLLAVNKQTGEELWRVEQDEPFASELACTSVPIVHGDRLLIHSARSVQAFDLSTGKQIWFTKCATTATSTPVIAGKDVIVAAWNKMGEPALRPEFPSYDDLLTGHDKNTDGLISRDEFPHMMIFHRPDGAEAPQNGAPLRFNSADRDRDGTLTTEEWSRKLAELDEFRSRYKTHGMLAIPVDSQGFVDAKDVRLLENQGIPEVPSPLYDEGILYFVKNGGVLTTVDVTTGKRLSRTRTKGKGTHYASPIIAGGKLYSTAGNGTISVMELGPRPKLLAVNDMRDRTYATPAAVDGVLYVRTHSRLYAFGD